MDEAGQDEAGEHGPQRRCIVTREHGERMRMIRFAVSPERVVVPDLAARLPGRGFWLSARADVVLAAQSRGAFARAARGPVTLPPDLLFILRSGLTRRVADHLGLARRAGQAVSGFAKAREIVTAGRARLVVQASDGSEEECRRFLSGARDITAVRPLSAAELGTVFGRDHVVHVAIMPGRLAEALIADTARLAGLSDAAGAGGTNAGKLEAAKPGGGAARSGPAAEADGARRDTKPGKTKPGKTGSGETTTGKTRRGGPAAARQGEAHRLGGADKNDGPARPSRHGHD